MLKKFIILSFTIILSLGLAELFLRQNKTTLVWIPDPYVGQRLKPNQDALFVSPTKEYKTKITTSDYGWHDINHDIKKPDNTYRILFLGDSFVENFQVPLDQTFFRQLQQNIPSVNGKSIEVLATGLGNTGTAQQLILFDKYSKSYQPDLVIQMFLTANDIKNNSSTLQNDPSLPYFKLDGDTLTEVNFSPKSTRPLARFKDFLEKFQIINLLLSLRQRLHENSSALKTNYPVDYHVYDVDYSKDYQDAWDITQKLILKTKEEVENAGGKYILVTLANNEQVNKNVWTEAQKTYPKMDTAKMDLQKPDKIIKDFCDDKKLTCWQMLPFFVDYASSHSGVTTHYHYDGHWNKLGTDLAAAFLTNNLRSYFSIK